MCTLQSCITFLKTSPATSSKRQLSGKTTAALPFGFKTFTICCKKFSCLFVVSTVKSSLVGIEPEPLVPNGGLERIQSYLLESRGS